MMLAEEDAFEAEPFAVLPDREVPLETGLGVFRWIVEVREAGRVEKFEQPGFDHWPDFGFVR